MITFSLFASLFITVPVAVLACEGECIIGITKAFCGNYSEVVNQVLSKAANEIALYTSPTSRSCLTPLLTAYEAKCNSTLENAIFPSYFHGKCQQNGVDPAGCPNPDCPVVCGTPGSLVHFYSKLIEIALNATRSLLDEIAEEKLNDIQAGVDCSHSQSAFRLFGRSGTQCVKDVRDKVEKTVKGIPARLEAACGGKECSKCSWETSMKEYILSFP